MNIRLILGSLLLAYGSFGLSAAIPQIVINPGSAGEKAIALNSISKIQFSKSGMEIVGNEDLTVPFSDIVKIVFSSASGINNPVLDSESPRLILGPGEAWLAIENLMEPAHLEIYSVSGLRLISSNSYQGEEINISSLPGDVYIVKAGNQYFKFLKR